MNLFKLKYPILLMLIVLNYQCSNRNTALAKKNNVPRDAIWYGGIDGGVWIKINDMKASKSYHAYIYNDFTGEIIDSGEYQICDYCEGHIRSNATEMITGYDGKKILLDKIIDGKNCYLFKHH